jgi:hypothetical protein
MYVDAAGGIPVCVSLARILKPLLKNPKHLQYASGFGAAVLFGFNHLYNVVGILAVSCTNQSQELAF